jgi:uncharacterized DUF497 family protein
LSSKQLQLTAHARERLRSRNIKLEWIEETVCNPVWTEPDPKDPAIERRFRAIEGFGGRILRIACIETEDAIRVISAMFDRNARRKP